MTLEKTINDLNEVLWVKWINSFAEVTEYLQYIDEFAIKDFDNDLCKNPALTSVQFFFDIPLDWL